jgi:general L-amino acid transport system permease protein
MSNDEIKTDTQSTKMAPRKTSVGVLGWLKENLFSSWSNTVLTIVFAVFSYLILKGSIQWVFFTAEWRVIADNFKLYVVGQYPGEHLWRPWMILSFISLLMGASWGIWKGTMGHLSISIAVLYLIVGILPFVTMESRLWLISNLLLIGIGYFIGKKQPKLKKATLSGWFLIFPITFFLLHGFGILHPVETNVWGGFLLTLLLAVVSITISFPIGVLLALGRRSKLPIVRWFSIGYIELIRGVPLITILFVGQLMIPLFLGSGIEIDKVVRAIIGFTLFSAAYLAENVRGGLQSIPRSQFEAAEALGFNTAQKTTFIILPQALRAVIPAMVGQFIGIFKDTTLVAIVGLIDLLGIAKKIIGNPEYLGLYMESYLFVALVFLIFCNLLSYASRRLEGALGVGKR